MAKQQENKFLVSPDQVFSLTPEQVQDLKNRIELQRYLQEEIEQREAAERMLKARKMGAESALESIQKQKELQERCSHLKENGTSALVGFRDHNHQVIYVCQFCQKVLTGDLPPHLQVPYEAIGGPAY